MKKLQIIEEFQSLIPSLTKEEYNLLEQNILKEGIRDPIIVYGDTIVDGHNRFEIAQKHGLKVDTVSKKFNSMDEAKVWIIENQLGRRNVSDFAKYELLEIKEQVNLVNIGKEKQGTRTDLLSTVDKMKPHDTRKIIANTLGWSVGKVGMAKLVKQNANLETLQKLREGKLTINGVYKKVKTSKKNGNNVNTQHYDNVENYKLRSVKFLLEIDNTITNYMKDNKIVDRDEAINELLSMGINYHYYVKEEI